MITFQDVVKSYDGRKNAIGFFFSSCCISSCIDEFAGRSRDVCFLRQSAIGKIICFQIRMVKHGSYYLTMIENTHRLLRKSNSRCSVFEDIKVLCRVVTSLSHRFFLTLVQHRKNVGFVDEIQRGAYPHML